MTKKQTLGARVEAAFSAAGDAERRVLTVFRDHREEVLVSSAARLAEKAQTSDATVIRAVKALGYEGMDDLRRQITDELRGSQTPASRLTRTLHVVGNDVRTALSETINVHLSALEALREEVAPEHFASLVTDVIAARRAVIFGIGPSSAIANYLVIQLRRFGLDAECLNATGLLFADDLRRLKAGDIVVILAYDRVYGELDALLEEGCRLGLKLVLVTDTLGETIGHRVNQVFRVARGRATMLSLHTATLGLMEALLVGIAVQRPVDTISNLSALNELRATVTGKAMDLPGTKRRRGQRSEPKS